MEDASPDARNGRGGAPPTTRPSRFIGTAPSILARHVGSADVLDVRMGGMKPGCTELTRMPSPASCTAAVFVMMRTAPLEALYAMCTPSWPTKPEIDEMLTMAPPPAFFMSGLAAFMPMNTPLT